MSVFQKLNSKLSDKKWFAFFRGFRLFHNVKLKIISLGLAMLLWIVVVSIDNPVMTLPFSPININVVNADIMEDEGKAFEISDSSKTIGISVKAERSVLSELSRDNFIATIDMANLEGNRVPIEVKATRYADKIESITPRQRYATVLIENLKSQQFKIQVVATGEVPEGYAVGNTSVATNVVRVSGPESIVSTIDRAEVHVNVSNMTSEIHSDERIILYDKNGSTVDASTLTLSIDHTYVTVDMWKTKEVSISAGYEGNVSSGYITNGINLSRKTAVITGEDSALDSVDEIVIPSSLINVDGTSKNVSVQVDMSRLLPSGISLVDEDPLVTVKVKVEALQSKIINVPVSNITFANVPEGMSAAIDSSDETVPLGISGKSNTLSGVEASDISGIIDINAVKQANNLDVLVENTYNASIVFALPSGVTQAADVTVQIVLHGQEAGTVSEEAVSDDVAGDSADDENAEKTDESENNSAEPDTEDNLTEDTEETEKEETQLQSISSDEEEKSENNKEIKSRAVKTTRTVKISNKANTQKSKRNTEE